MMEKLRKKDFDKVYDLMEKSFPIDEYRPYSEQKALLDDPAYTVYVLYDESCDGACEESCGESCHKSYDELYDKLQDIKAFIAVWEFDDFAFVEHFAVHPDLRNCGIGAHVLNELAVKLGKMVCLEVEPPETEMAARRIGFYERNGFFLNEYQYMQPPISKGRKAIPLLIMTSGGKADREIFEHIKDTLYSRVYKYSRT